VRFIQKLICQESDKNWVIFYEFSISFLVFILVINIDVEYWFNSVLKKGVIVMIGRQGKFRRLGSTS
jgi:hypothetical protein